MTIAVDLGRKATKQTNRDIYSILPTRFCSVAEEAQMQILMGKQNCAG